MSRGELLIQHGGAAKTGTIILLAPLSTTGLHMSAEVDYF
jgi:hypothetical protein